MKATFDADFSDFNREVDKSVVKMQQFEDEAGKMGPPVVRTVDLMKNSFSQFDATLNAVGLHAGQSMRALEEITAAAGRSFTELGAIATGGLVVGTAMAAWDLGKRIDEVVHFSDDVEYLAEAMGGFARETAVAAAQQDVLARASTIAREQILSVADAIEILNEAQRAAQRTQAPGETADQIKKWAGELALVNQSGVLKSLEADLKSHNFTLKQLADLYGVSVEALQYFQREIANTDRATEHSRKLNEQHDKEWRQQLKEQDEAREKHAAAVKKANEELLQPVEGGPLHIPGASPADLLGIGQRVPQSAMEALRKAGFTGGGVAGPTAEELQNPFTQLAETTRKLNEEMDSLVRAGNTRNEAEQALTDRRKAAMDAFTASLMKGADANDAWINSLTPKGAGMFAGGESILPWSTLGPKPITVKPIGPYAAGSAAAAAAGGVNTTVQVSGVLDPRTINELAAAVSKAIMSQLGRPTPNA